MVANYGGFNKNQLEGADQLGRATYPNSLKT